MINFFPRKIFCYYENFYDNFGFYKTFCVEFLIKAKKWKITANT